MAIIGADKVSELIKTQNLIEGLDENNLNIEGCGIDLRIGEIHELESGEGFLHIETRSSPKYKEIAKFNGEPGTKVKIMPGKVYSALTVEKINTPENLFGWIVARHTFYKNGVEFLGKRTDPGYKGKFGFMLINHSDRPFEIELGARVCNVVFHTIEGKANLYIGQWQGGRTHIEKEEVQTKQQ